jgi:hypothetical protein
VAAFENIVETLHSFGLTGTSSLLTHCPEHFFTRARFLAEEGSDAISLDLVFGYCFDRKSA